MDDFLLYFARGTSLPSVHQPAYRDSTCLGVTFPLWKCPGEITYSSLTAPRCFGKNSKWQSKKCTWKDITPHSFVQLYNISYHITIIAYLLISQKYCSDFFLWYPCCLFSWSSSFTSYINALVLGPTNATSLILVSLILGNIFSRYINQLYFDTLPWQNFLWAQSLLCSEGKQTFLGFIKGLFTAFFCPGISNLNLSQQSPVHH